MEAPIHAESPFVKCSWAWRWRRAHHGWRWRWRRCPDRRWWRRESRGAARVKAHAILCPVDLTTTAVEHGGVFGTRATLGVQRSGDLLTAWHRELSEDNGLSRCAVVSAGRAKNRSGAVRSHPREGDISLQRPPDQRDQQKRSEGGEVNIYAKQHARAGAPGSIKKTAPSAVSMPCCSVHALKSMPMLLMAPCVVAGPSMPIVMKESNSVSGFTAKNAGFVGPVLVPKGIGTWKAGGRRRLWQFKPSARVQDRDCSPNTAYTSAASRTLKSAET